MIRKKKKVVYTRVSSDQQSLEMQLEAAKPYIKEYNPDEIVRLNDHGVSALKNKLEQRPALKELLDLIRNDEVDTLIVYQRDRLAREFYEYLEIILLIYTHKVKVIFTATGHLPFNHDIESGIHSEGLFGMLSQIEGMNITNRTKDAFEKAPHSILGYIVDRDENKKTYSINPEYKHIIQALYTDCLAAKSSKDLIALFLRYKKQFGRTEADVLNILVRPFYAGYFKMHGEYQRLEYVPPIITLDVFKKVQNHLQNLIPNLDLYSLTNSKMPLFIPKCHVCCEPLLLSRGLENDILKCKKHRKIRIGIDVMNALATEVVTEALDDTNFEHLESIALTVLYKSKKSLESQRASIQKKYDEIQWKVFTELNFARDKELVHEHLNSISNISDEYQNLAERQAVIEKRIVEVKHLVELVAEKMKIEFNEFHEILIPGFIKEIFVHDGYVNFELYSSDFNNHKTG
ncbi:recombinase family protein [Sutcliffiella horikoshii]|uniref:recombinase family protein n=1 Tax=Sutcliffiella horikoshii TaxID=79883 RepID=UPI003CF6ADAA